MYFVTPLLCTWLTEKAKQKLEWEVDRSTPQKRIEDFVGRADGMAHEMRHVEMVSSVPFLRKLTASADTISIVQFALSIVINTLVLLCTFPDNTPFSDGADGTADEAADEAEALGRGRSLFALDSAAEMPFAPSAAHGLLEDFLEGGASHGLKGAVFEGMRRSLKGGGGGLVGGGGSDAAEQQVMDRGPGYWQLIYSPWYIEHVLTVLGVVRATSSRPCPPPSLPSPPPSLHTCQSQPRVAHILVSSIIIHL